MRLTDEQRAYAYKRLGDATSANNIAIELFDAGRDFGVSASWKVHHAVRVGLESEAGPLPFEQVVEAAADELRRWFASKGFTPPATK